VTPECHDNLLDTSLHPSNKVIGHGDFDTFYISHNIYNVGNAKIFLFLVCSCSGSIRPEDLLMGKIVDNGILTTG
jgi:hypothetical protein